MSIDREIESLQIAWRSGQQQARRFLRLNPHLCPAPCGQCHKIELFSNDSGQWRCTGTHYDTARRIYEPCGASLNQDGMEIAKSFITTGRCEP